MKIATFNINNINKRLDNLLAWLTKTEPDIVCLQELRAAQDIYPTRSLDDNALIQPQSREAFSRLLAQGWTDALRKVHPHGPLWTFWDYKRERWAADKGMRLDHVLLSPDMAKQVVAAGV